MLFRHYFVLAACALAPFAMTGCADDPAAEAPRAAFSPAEASADLCRSLGDLEARIRTVDATYARLVGVSATDPNDRVIALNKATAALGSDTVASLAADFLSHGETLATDWAASTEDKVKGAANAAVVRSRFATVRRAARLADAAVADHARVLREAIVSLGSKPGSATLVASRPYAARLNDAGALIAMRLVAVNKAVREAGFAPVPEPKPVEAKSTGEGAPDKPVAPSPSENVAKAPAPAAVSEPVPAPEPVPEPVEDPVPPSAPVDPVPEPVDA